MALVLTSTEFECTNSLVPTFLCCGKVLTSIGFEGTNPLVRCFITPETPGEKIKNKFLGDEKN